MSISKSLKEGDEVIWKSKSGGVEKIKIGEVVDVIAAGQSVRKSRFASELDAPGQPRSEESYIICVGPKPGSKAKPKYYWPRVSYLSINK